MAALAAVAVTPVQAQTPDEIISRGKVVIAIDTTVPPYGMLDANNQPAGIDVDVANAIGANLKVPVEFVTVNSPGPHSGAAEQPGRHGGRHLLDHRRTRTAGVVLDPLCRPVGRADRCEGQGHQGPRDLKGLKVGVTRGALEDGALTTMNPEGMELLRFDDGPSVAQALLSGQIDAWGRRLLRDLPRKGAQGEEYEQKFPLRAAHFGIGIRKGNPELLQWLNTFVYQIKNTGELDAISRKHRNNTPMIALPVF
jgi:polar amino acid transport system substrate-binding protein